MPTNKGSTKAKGAARTGRGATASRAKRASKPDGRAAAGKKSPKLPPHPDGHPLPPGYIAGESEEDRQKRLAAKKELTLLAFRLAYEEHRRRKKS